MKYFVSLLFGILFLLSTNARAAAVDEFSPNFLMAKEPHTEPHFKAEVGFGLLDDSGITGEAGTPVLANFGAGFEVVDHLEAGVLLPMAGTISSGNDDFGIGNITFEVKYIKRQEGFSWGIGSDLALPTASSGSQIGKFTRHFIRYVEDQFAISPFALASYTRERFTVSFDLSTDLQIYTDTPAGLDDVEMLIGYDAGVGYAFQKNYWLTIEFGGHSAVSFDEDTQFFGGAGIRYQDYQFASGLMLMAPFASPSRDQIDLIAMLDLRLLF